MVERTARHLVTVEAVTDLTPRMRRITVAGPTLTDLRPSLLQDVAIVLTDDAGHEVRRRYTVCNYAGDRLDIDAVLHGHGPGAAWAGSAKAGDEVVLYGPRAGAHLVDADWYLLAADESGLPAVAELLRALPARPTAVFGEVADPAEEQAVRDRAGLEVTWLHRGATPPGTPELFGPALTAWQQPAGAGAAYVLGESRVVSALREVMLGKGIGRTHVHAKGYWTAATRRS